jgi:tetratricopeptide (TPR) repeat protein
MPAAQTGLLKTAAANAPLSKTARRMGSIRKAFRAALYAFAIIAVLNEIGVAVSANRVADRVPMRELDTLPEDWGRYESLSRHSLGVGTIALEHSLVAHTRMLTDRVIGKYRAGVSTVWEPEWKMARDTLARAIADGANQKELRASLRYCDGQLHRISGDARKKKGESGAAQEEFAAAVAAFREAAELRADWPDPFLGLARTFISSLADVDRGADALKQAERLGYKSGERETLLLAVGYHDRGDALVRSARQLMGLPQEKDQLNRAVTAYEQALDFYLQVPGSGEATSGTRQTQQDLARAHERLSALNPEG